MIISYPALRAHPPDAFFQIPRVFTPCGRDTNHAERGHPLLRGLTDCRETLNTLALLEQTEQEGTTFMDKQKHHTKRRRYIAPVVISCLTTVLMTGCIWLMLWAYAQDPADAPPLPVLALLVAIPGAVALGVILALVCRLREIQKGEEDDAKQY